jgi:hypothetical protein
MWEASAIQLSDATLKQLSQDIGNRFNERKYWDQKLYNYFK